MIRMGAMLLMTRSGERRVEFIWIA